jgi:hypothetical protein
MKIALLVPTRERMNRRLTLLFSILTTVKDINNIKVYFGVDKDDPTLDTIKKVATAIPCLKIVEINNNGKFVGLGKIWNTLTRASNEEIVATISDDSVFKTQDWDEMVIKEFSSAPADNLYAIYCNDDWCKETLAVNLFCHRKYTEILGGLMREEFIIIWVDQWNHQMFSAVNRLKYRDDIMIEHRHWVIGKDRHDKVAERMALADGNKISDRLWHELVNERISDVKKIADYLKQTPDWVKVDTGGRKM